MSDEKKFARIKQRIMDLQTWLRTHRDVVVTLGDMPRRIDEILDDPDFDEFDKKTGFTNKLAELSNEFAEKEKQIKEIVNKLPKKIN